jgi:hypothetical protein
MIELIQLDHSEMKGFPPQVRLLTDSWVAGGSIRRWFTGEPQNSDIDIFVKNANKNIIDELITANKVTEILMQTDKNITFKKDDKIIQIIIMPFENIKDCLDKFDYCLCQFALDHENNIYATKNAIDSVTKKHLAIHEIQKGYEIDSLRRAFKYQSQGYNPCMGTLRDLTTAILKMNMEEIDNQTILSPGGNQKLKFKWD